MKQMLLHISYKVKMRVVLQYRRLFVALQGYRDKIAVAFVAGFLYTPSLLLSHTLLKDP